MKGDSGDGLRDIFHPDEQQEADHARAQQRTKDKTRVHFSLNQYPLIQFRGVFFDRIAIAGECGIVVVKRRSTGYGGLHVVMAAAHHPPKHEDNQDAADPEGYVGDHPEVRVRIGAEDFLPVFR